MKPVVPFSHPDFLSTPGPRRGGTRLVELELHISTASRLVELASQVSARIHVRCAAHKRTAAAAAALCWCRQAHPTAATTHISFCRGSARRASLRRVCCCALCKTAAVSPAAAAARRGGGGRRGLARAAVGAAGRPRARLLRADLPHRPSAVRARQPAARARERDGGGGGEQPPARGNMAARRALQRVVPPALRRAGVAALRGARRRRRGGAAGDLGVGAARERDVHRVFVHARGRARYRG